MSSYWKPESFVDENGNERKVGFELEFGGVSSADVASSLNSTLGGELQEKNPFIFYLQETPIGKVKIERDAHLLNSVKYREVLEKLQVDFSPGMPAHEMEREVDRLSSILVPCEVVTAPLEHGSFEHVESIVDVLASMRAEGSQDSWLNAYGLHLNPSLPDLSVETFVRFMQAFLLLHEWIEAHSGVDFTRRVLTNYINPFHEEYARLVLDETYAPDFAGFLDLYVAYNPTRNRALDLLPALSERDREGVLKGVRPEERELVGSRPAFHYRLPDCRIGDASWSVAAEWNRWWYVEKLASDRDMRMELARLWKENRTGTLLFRKKEWVQAVDDFLEKHVTPPGESDG